VNDFGAHALQNTAHDIDGSIVTIKQAGCRDKANFVSRSVIGKGFEFGRQVGHGKVPFKDEKGRIAVRPCQNKVDFTFTSTSTGDLSRFT
jgi:hypothetical protein